MKPAVFVDTHFLLALANPRDQWHRAAARASAEVEGELVTTDAVLLEVADGLAGLGDRERALEVIDALREDPLVEIVPLSGELFESGLALFRKRNDKSWSLTDCTSFSLMRKRGIQEALTGDRHFRQAGFGAPLL